jgi:Endoplasmic Reticulum-Golgi Intermediate Compartment (ERGIC)
MMRVQVSDHSRSLRLRDQTSRIYPTQAIHPSVNECQIIITMMSGSGSGSSSSISTWTNKIKKCDAHSSVANEFRVYTLHGAILSVTTVALILYLATSEVSYNFQTILHERVHVNATNTRGLEMEFDISITVPCGQLQIDANDHHGQSQR